MKKEFKIKQLLIEELEPSIKKEKNILASGFRTNFKYYSYIRYAKLTFPRPPKKARQWKREKTKIVILCFVKLLAKYHSVLKKVIYQGNYKINYCSPRI